MTLNWKFRRRLGNRPLNLRLFLAISLLLHGAVFLGLENYWHRFGNHPLQTKPDTLLPVKFIEMPAGKVAGGSPNGAKAKASANSRTGGEVSSELPRQHALPPQQPHVAPRRNVSPLASHEFMGNSRTDLPNANSLAPDGNPDISSPVTRTWPKPEASSRQTLRPNAGFLGGSGLATGEFMGNGRDQLSNGNGLGSDSQGVGAGQKVDLGPYLERLKRQVKQQWRPELTRSSEHTIISFAVSRTGQISDLRIVKPSGSTLTDQAELQAIQRAAPFAPLPEGYRAAELDIQFNFNQIQF